MTTILAPQPESISPTTPECSPSSSSTQVSAQTTSASTFEALPPEAWPNLDHLVTEDDTPVDNIFSEKQQRLLVESLYASWVGPGEERPFLAFANVGLFYALHQPPFVPDVLISLDVQLPEDIWTKAHRSYLVWEYGKPPEVVIEIVSNRQGHEMDRKLRDYARIGITYYIVYDPTKQLGNQELYLYERRRLSYLEMTQPWLPEVELGITLWHGQYEDREDTWLRWCDHHGNLIGSGRERAERERQCAEQERQRAEQEYQRAEQERQRAEQANQEKEQALFELEQERQRVAQLTAQLQASETNKK